MTMSSAAERYVKLVLAMGEHDTDYVDAYYGPPEWREEVRTENPALPVIHARAVALRGDLAALPRPDEPLLALRRDYLQRQTEALIARAEMLQGRRFTFDEESKALYDAVAPTHSEDYFRAVNASIERELPGEGPLVDRVEAFRKEFTIPPDRLDAVFNAAIEGCRERTMQHIDLPPGETFTVEYVTNKSWSGYNWYQGNFNSLIQVNKDLPIYVDRAIDLACHEGYPGHHVYNALLEKHLVDDRGWVELSVYPLYSPQSLIAEGSANYGIDLAFPGDERLKFETEVLYPLAGLPTAEAADYLALQEAMSDLAGARFTIAADYLEGRIDRGRAIALTQTYQLVSRERAEQSLDFVDQYRSYVINYGLGEDMVRAYVEAAGPGEEARWGAMERVISEPTLPGDLLKR